MPRLRSRLDRIAPSAARAASAQRPDLSHLSDADLRARHDALVASARPVPQLDGLTPCELTARYFDIARA
jgi:hypothetical protein